MTIHSGRPTPNPDLDTWPLPDGLRARLMREHGWTEAFAEQAEAEYRRFVYLATLGRAVTPSPAVDEVWHTHLMYTRDYWGGFQALLPAPLHHEPGTDAPGDAARLRAQYLDTLALYERTFGEPAPVACWPRPAAPATPRPAAAAGLWGWAGVALVGLMGTVLTGTPLFLLLTALGFGLLAVWLGRRGGHSGHSDGAAGAGGLVLFGLDIGGDGGGSDSGSGGDSGSSDGGSCGSGCGGGCGS